MGISFSPQRYEFTCRKCGRHRKARFSVPYPVTKKYAADCVFMKNTRWGAECSPDCEMAKERDAERDKRARQAERWAAGQ